MRNMLSILLNKYRKWREMRKWKVRITKNFKDLENQQYTVTAQKNGYRTDRKTINLNAGTSQEEGAKVAKEYCQAIARIIVTQAIDYEPDGTIDGEADFT